MNDQEILEKAERNEGLTIEEIKQYRNLVKPQRRAYGN